MKLRNRVIIKSYRTTPAAILQRKENLTTGLFICIIYVGRAIHEHFCQPGRQAVADRHSHFPVHRYRRQHSPCAEYPDALPDLIARHHAILQKSIEASNGYVFQIIGDAFCAAFHTASDALHAALAAQQELQQADWEPAPVPVRMGIHTGAAQVSNMDDRSSGYRGYLTMACTQRVMSSAHGGQVLLSSASAELVRGQLPNHLTLRDMGEHRLKGLVNPEHLWQMVASDLRAEFPPILIIGRHPQQPPGAADGIYRTRSGTGRDCEAPELTADMRLLTLTGPGGIGKTRMSLQAAAELIERFEDGVYFVDLAPIRDPEAVPTAIARTLGLRETSDRPLLDELKEQLRAKKMLLLLDNFEQVTAAATKVGGSAPRLSSAEAAGDQPGSAARARRACLSRPPAGDAQDRAQAVHRATHPI